MMFAEGPVPPGSDHLAGEQYRKQHASPMKTAPPEKGGEMWSDLLRGLLRRRRARRKTGRLLRGDTNSNGAEFPDETCLIEKNNVTGSVSRRMPVQR